jgi:hypothetical protein
MRMLLTESTEMGVVSDTPYDTPMHNEPIVTDDAIEGDWAPAAPNLERPGHTAGKLSRFGYRRPFCRAVGLVHALGWAQRRW